MQSAWLLLNLVWLHAVVPALLARAIAAFHRPQSGIALKFLAAVAAIVVIPLLAIVGFALVTWLVLARVERAMRRAVS
ncbi:MAG: hypothetical protein PVF27_00495 [Gemmatimonadales bacterium]|jgi:hypothetical protein